jgi:DNA-binding transcriptional LysR family regulator
MQTVVGLVAADIGVALVPASLRNLRRRGVVYKPVYGLSPTVELGMVWRSDDPGADLHSFVRVVRDGVQSESSAGEDQERQQRLDPS